MLRALVALLLLVAACDSSDSRGFGAGDSAETGTDPGAGAPAPGAGQCITDGDCEAVASSCCDCPTFALPVFDGVAGTCEDVTCNAPLDCPAQQAICDTSGTCVLACAEVSCDLSCSNGFALDEAGCATCACAAVDDTLQCETAADCQEVPADCCGCARGGKDTAVATTEAAAFIDALGCTGSEACPEVDICDAAAEPTCHFGRCLLVNPALADDPGVAVCGATDSPTCPEGTACVLNPRAHPMVAAAGLGACL